LTVFSGNTEILKTRLSVPPLDGVLSTASSDSPFVAIDATEIIAGRGYAYRFPARGEPVVVICADRSPGDYSMQPILVLKPDAASLVSGLKVRWTDAAAGGAYYLAAYAAGKIPARTQD